MAEFCKDCYVSVLGGDPKDKLVLSRELDLCEGCGEYKQVVVRIKRPPFQRLRDIIENIRNREV